MHNVKKITSRGLQMILNLPPNFLKFHHHSYKLFVYSNGVQTSHEGYFKNYFYFKLVSYFKNALLIMPNGLISNKCIRFYYHMLKYQCYFSSIQSVSQIAKIYHLFDLDNISLIVQKVPQNLWYIDFVFSPIMWHFKFSRQFSL